MIARRAVLVYALSALSIMLLSLSGLSAHTARTRHTRAAESSVAGVRAVRSHTAERQVVHDSALDGSVIGGSTERDQLPRSRVKQDRKASAPQIVITPELVLEYAGQLRRHLSALTFRPVGHQAELFYATHSHCIEEARAAWRNGAGPAFLGVYLQELRRLEHKLADTYETIAERFSIAQKHAGWTEHDEYEATLGWLEHAQELLGSEITMYEEYVLQSLDKRV